MVKSHNVQVHNVENIESVARRRKLKSLADKN